MCHSLAKKVPDSLINTEFGVVRFAAAGSSLKSVIAYVRSPAVQRIDLPTATASGSMLKPSDLSTICEDDSQAGNYQAKSQAEATTNRLERRLPRETSILSLISMLALAN